MPHTLVDPSPLAKNVPSKSVVHCSDPSVVPSINATERTKELWWLHGHPHSKRYSDAKLVSLGALVRHDGLLYKGQKAFLYPASAEPATKYKSMTWDEFDSVTETIALSYASQLRSELDKANVTQIQPTLALLGEGKTLEYFCTQLALQKLGVRVLLLAESNALNALHYLLESCQVWAVIVDSKNSKTDIMNLRKLDMIQGFPQSRDFIYADLDAVKFQDFGDVWERHSFIIHSSGSTGMPKPIIHTNRSMMLIARMYRLFQDFEVENWFLLFPLYHIAGISIALSGLPNGQILSFPILSWPPSSSSTFKAWETLTDMGHPVHCVHCAPTLIENMYDYILDHGSDFTPLSSLKLLQPGGAALSDSIIQELVSNGVNVKTTYGSTEIGPPFRSIPHTRDNPKCYSFRNLYPDNPFLKMEEVGESLYECVVHKGFELAANLWENSDDPYRTNDLFIQDPPNSGFFVLQGRKDDMLIHSNGENTSAGALQLDIQTASKIICRVLAVGHSQPCVGLLVEIHKGYDPDSPSIRAAVWEMVQQVNSRYPKHSQVTENMIHVLPMGSMLPVTPKGNIKRKEACQLYSSEIADLFSYLSTPPSRETSRNMSSSEALSEYLRKLLSSISNVTAPEIHDWTTLYDLGIDSRLALTLRSSLSTYVGRSVSLSTLFENPSVSALVSHLSSRSSSASASSPDPIPSEKTCQTQNINRIISTLASEFKTWPPLSSSHHTPTTKETVLLTGASGSLGTALLKTLSASSNVIKIYAMVRGPKSLSRLRKSLDARGMDASILEPGGKIEVLNFSMQDPLLGLDVDVYARLAMDVTIVVQNAWKMDFNVRVQGFEDDCLRNTMSLLRLCHAGRRKTLAFTSSISTCMGAGQVSINVPEEPIGADPTVALPTGYAQSKYIVERLTQLASASKNLMQKVVLLRVGQLCGSTETGMWNTNEMWPIMFATSLHPGMRCIPEFRETKVDWIPVDVAADTISELLISSNREEDEGMYQVFNIVNPRSVPWSDLVSMLQASTFELGKLEVVPMTEWVSRLSALSSTLSPDELPGLRLLQFFEGMASAEGKGHESSKVFDTEKSRAISQSLRECKPFRREWMERNLEVWKENGFL
ncbi:Nonribosomal peptide synthase [Hyphodiscus hymeniophilus]|uniref:Nonribosomal peptide synthase n=1 Tax=Hyphodiscus hymeniophilus TaxID=353542 RepID=A0A9P7AW96_9HELO|nr:Nonribosomal peptide synthase [Hyphodiscus hymeniophilus]